MLGCSESSIDEVKMHTNMRAVATVAVLLLLSAAAPLQAQKPHAPGDEFLRDLRTKTAVYLEEAAVALDGVLGYAIVDLTSGDTFERMSSVPFPTASTIKLAILYELVRRADEGTLSLDDTIRLDRKRAVPGGLLYELGTPTLSLRDYANAMIIESDNTATNVLIERLGMEAITSRMGTLGLGSIKLRRYMIDIEAARKGLENVATPADLAKLLQAFHKSVGLTPSSQAEALRILKKPSNSPIRRAVPAKVEIARKDGALEGVRADTAIVYVKNRPFVIVAMSTYLQDESAADKAIERLATAAYNYFARVGGAAPETGRQLYR
jgi:beta-lactamase class A